MITGIILSVSYIISVVISYYFVRIYFRNMEGREKSLILALSILIPAYNLVVSIYCLFILIDESPKVNKNVDDFVIKVFRLDK